MGPAAAGGGGTIRPTRSFSQDEFCLAVAFDGNRRSNATALDLYYNYTLAPSWFGSRDYIDRHGAFFSSAGQWFFVMNDESHSLEPAAAAYFFRDSVAAYVHYRDNGTIAPLVVNEIGVGEYDGTSWIPAENFMALHPDAIKRCAKRKKCAFRELNFLMNRRYIAKTGSEQAYIG